MDPTFNEDEEVVNETLVDSEGRNALHRACMDGNLEKVKLLVELGYQMEYPTRSEARATPFLVAVRAGRLEVAQWFVEARKNQNKTSESYVQGQIDGLGSTSMMYGVESGNLELVMWLDKMGVSVHDRNQRGSTVMMWATRDKSLAIIKWLVSKGVSLTERNHRQMTPASYAAFDGQLGVMQYFLSQNVPFDIISASGYSMVLLAVESGVIENVKWLLSIGQGGSLSDVNQNGSNCIYLAASLGKLTMLKWLHEEMGFQLETKNTEGATTMIAAVKSGQIEVVEYLLSKGQKLEERPEKESLCMLAALGGHVSMLKYLVQTHGISLERVNKRRDTVEIIAAMKGQLSVLKWLIEEKGRSPHCVNKFECGLAWWAAKNGHIHILEYLTSIGVNLQRLDRDKESPAMQAAFHGQINALKWLYRHGCSLTLNGSTGQNCLYFALRKGYIPIVKWLLSIGIEILPLPEEFLPDESVQFLQFLGFQPV